MIKYEIDFKIEVIKFYKETSFTYTLSKYNISNIALVKWVDDSEGGTFIRKQNNNYTIKLIEKYNIYSEIYTEK